MKASRQIPSKICSLNDLLKQVRRWRLQNKKIAFTNGVFDILHIGHIASLSEAAAEADILIVGLNSDSSVRRLKGPGRPVHDQDARAVLLASLLMTDAIVIFDEDNPLALISQLMPDVLIKGGDYTIEQIIGAKEVIAAGGRVKIAEIIPGNSTTNIIEKMKNNDQQNS